MVKYKGILAISGGFLLHLTLGTLYTFGNLNPYVTSYIRLKSEPSSLTYSQTVFLFAAAAGAQGLLMFFGGILTRKLGSRLTALLGAWIMSAGVMLSSVTIRHSFILLFLTYGIMFGLGVGIAYAVPLAIAMRWYPERKGVVNGIVVAGFGLGAFIFNQVQTKFVNPENFKPDIPNPNPDIDEKYFGQDALLRRVPHLFLLLGAVYAGMQVVGCLMLCDTPPPRSSPLSQVTPQGEKQDDSDDEERSPLLRHNDDDDESLPPDSLTGRSLRGAVVLPESLTPRQVLKTRHFYMLWFMFLFNGQAVFFVSTLYKAYGQTFISDDEYFALVGAFAAVFNAVGRIFWGFIADRYSFKVAMVCLCGAMMVLMLTFIGCQHGGKVMYFIWVCLLFGVFSGNFALFPTATAKSFGQQYVAVNFGLVFSSQLVSPFVGALLSSQLSAAVGWFGMFLIITGFVFLALLLAVFYDKRDSRGRDI